VRSSFRNARARRHGALCALDTVSERPVRELEAVLTVQVAESHTDFTLQAAVR